MSWLGQAPGSAQAIIPAVCLQLLLHAMQVHAGCGRRPHLLLLGLLANGFCIDGLSREIREVCVHLQARG